MAQVEKLIMPKLDDSADEEMAQIWIDEYTNDYTTIQIIGRGGKVATLPYNQKDLLPRVLSIFNH